MGQHLIQLLPSGQQPVPVRAVDHKDEELASRGGPEWWAFSLVKVSFAQPCSLLASALPDASPTENKLSSLEISLP